MTAEPTNSRIRLRPPVTPTPGDDVAVISQVFGIGPTSGIMVQLTRTPAKTLSRASNAIHIRPRTHLEIVAELARTLRDHFFVDRQWSRERADGMRRWLEEGEFVMNGVAHRPIDVLSDDDLARAALAILNDES